MTLSPVTSAGDEGKEEEVVADRRPHDGWEDGALLLQREGRQTEERHRKGEKRVHGAQLEYAADQVNQRANEEEKAAEKGEEVDAVRGVCLHATQLSDDVLCHGGGTSQHILTRVNMVGARAGEESERHAL